MWHLTDPFLYQFRVRFTNRTASEKFSDLVGLMERSKASSDVRVDKMASRSLKGHVSELLACQWDDEEQAFEEVDTLTSTFALFNDNT